jgi:hypothetical protein
MIYVFKEGSPHKNSYYGGFNEGRNIAVNGCDWEISREVCILVCTFTFGPGAHLASYTMGTGSLPLE